MGKFDRVHYSNDMLISSDMISEAIDKLEIGKSTGPNGVYAESIKFTKHVCATVIIKHNYMLKCNHKIVINILLCLLNSTGHIQFKIYGRPLDL